MPIMHSTLHSSSGRLAVVLVRSDYLKSSHSLLWTITCVVPYLSPFAHYIACTNALPRLSFLLINGCFCFKRPPPLRYIYQVLLRDFRAGCYLMWKLALSIRKVEHA